MTTPATPFTEFSFITVDDGAPLTWQEFLQWNPDLQPSEIEDIKFGLIGKGEVTLGGGADAVQTIRRWEGGAK